MRRAEAAPLPPIVESALSLLGKSAQGSLVFSPASAATLAGQLEATPNGERFSSCLFALVQLAALLEKRFNAPEAARAILATTERVARARALASGARSAG